MSRFWFAVAAAVVTTTHAAAEVPERSEATVIWTISHPKSGSVAQMVSGSDRFTLTFPRGPIVSGANIDLPPKIQTDGGLKGWGQWTIPAHIRIEETETTKDRSTLKKRPTRGWKLFAKLRDGRVIEARKGAHGIDGGSYSGDGIITQISSAMFNFWTNVKTRRELEIFTKQTGIGVFVEVFPAEKPQLWRDVTELWLIDR